MNKCPSCEWNKGRAKIWRDQAYSMIPPKQISDDAKRYQWLRSQYAQGKETYLAEDMPSGEELDRYIDSQMEKEIK